MHDWSSLSHVRWDCKYHVVVVPKYRKKYCTVACGSRLERSFESSADRRGWSCWKGICFRTTSICLPRPPFSKGRHFTILEKVGSRGRFSGPCTDDFETINKELYLRMRCWWNANDPWRRLSDPKPAFSPEQVKNLEALSALFDESLPGHRILKAEIARELGKFDECLLLLSGQFEPDYDWTVGFIRKLAEEKVRTVKPFERGK